MEDFKKLALNIRKYRKMHRLTQAQLAEMTGIHRGMIGRLENEDYTPTIDQLQKRGFPTSVRALQNDGLSSPDFKIDIPQRNMILVRIADILQL